MAFQVVFAERMNRRVAPEQLMPGVAYNLRAVDVSRAGLVERGPGFCRPNFTSGETTTVQGAGVLLRRDGTRIAVWSNAAGVWKAQVAPAAAYQDSDY